MVDVKDEDGEQNEENEKDANNADEDLFNAELINEDNRSSVNHQSTYSNATLVYTHLNTSDQAVNPHQEYSNQVKVETRQQMMTDKPVHPPYLAPTFINEDINGMCLFMKL